MPSTRASRQFEGLIVSNRQGSGSDSFVDIFSPEYGIVGVVAKGARASKKRFAGGLDIGTFGRFVAEDSGKLLWRLDSMSVLFQPLALRSDLDWLTSLSLMVEAIHSTSAAGQPEPELYAKVRDAVVMLDAGAIQNAASIWRDIRVCGGHMTRERHCEACGSKPYCRVSYAPPRLSCSGCAPPNSEPLPPLFLEDEARNASLSEAELRADFLLLERFFAKWFERTSGTQLKSARLLSKLGG